MPSSASPPLAFQVRSYMSMFKLQYNMNLCMY